MMDHRSQLEEAVRTLEARLGDADPEQRQIAAETLGALGGHAVPALETMVERSIADGDPPVRYALLAALERIGWEPVAFVPLFMSLLDDPDQIVQARAAWALGRIGPSAAPAVLDLARISADTSRLVDPRWSAVVALGRLGQISEVAVPTLIPLLADDDPDMREAAARALGAISASHEVVSALERALADDDDQLVRDGAAVGLGEIGRAAVDAVPALEARCADDWPAVCAAAREALKRITGNAPRQTTGNGASEVIVAAELPERLAGLESDDERKRGISTFEIGKLGPDAAEAVPLLAGLLCSDHNLDVRWSAAWAFGKMGDAGVGGVPALARAVSVDPDADVRAQAAWAIGRIARDSIGVAELTVEVLHRALGDADSLVREEAAGALGVLGRYAVRSLPELARCAADPHPLVRRRAVDAIAAVGRDARVSY